MSAITFSKTLKLFKKILTLSRIKKMRNDSAGGFQPRLFSRSFQKGQINLIFPKGTSFGRSGGGEI
ncbi:MAG: hypothetical protein COS68_06130 [Elusimicrobia bacterium CG06_land_8_20_14_3_00_38_11]|nr:MAG: hypothetical protein COS68_06130 [Elusimicrobia bacterium CG06_land_8_20_14_3_00_38_11]